MTSDAFDDAGVEEGDVGQLYGLKVLLASPLWDLTDSPQSGLDLTTCNGITPTACSAPPAEMAARMGEIVETLRVLWGKEFDSNYKRYMMGLSPTVVLIPRREMIRIANARIDGRSRDGEVTQGLNIDYQKIVVVYDDIPPLFVARSIHHEIGHQQLRNAGLSRNDEEARVRKVVDTASSSKSSAGNGSKPPSPHLKERSCPSEDKAVSTMDTLPRPLRSFTYDSKNAE